MNLLISTVTALLLCVLAIATLRLPATVWGLVDRPGGRKHHQGEIPLVGGLGIFSAFLVALPFTQGASFIQYFPLLVAMLILLVYGLLDDLRDLSSSSKLFFQLLAATLVVAWGGLTLDMLGHFPVLGEVTLGAWAVPLTIFAIVGLVNAVNMMDGLDGLAGGLALVILFWFGFIAALQGDGSTLAVIALLASAVAGFLLFNMRSPWRAQASVFLGDSGSLILGLALAWFALDLSQGDRVAISPVAFGWVLALPVVDTLSLMARRLLKGKSPFVADRDHMHHLFLRAGYTPGQTTAILVATSFLLGAVGVFGSLAGIPDVLLAVGLLVVAVLHFVFVRFAWRTMRALRRLRAISTRPAYGDAWLDTVADMVPPMWGWRRFVALAGLYLFVLCIPTFPAFAGVGLGLVLVATLAAPAAFWLAIRRMPLFWICAALSIFVVVRGALGPEAFSPNAQWVRLSWLAGLAAFPMAWWLAGLRQHWYRLLGALFLSAAVAFAAQADWASLQVGDFASHHAWGPPEVTGFLGAVLLMAVLAMLMAGLQRLGRGWRPLFTVFASLALAVPIVAVLAASRYTTGWIGAGFGGVVLGLAATGYSLTRHQWAGLAGGSLLLLGVAIGTWQLTVAEPGAIHEAFAAPLEAVSLYRAGDVEQSRAAHAATADRLFLWTLAYERVMNRPLVGTGTLLPDVQDGLRRTFTGYESMYVSLAVGFGGIGVLLFATVFVLSVREVLVAARRRVWPQTWVMGVLAVIGAIAGMLLLTEQLGHSGSRAMILLVIALCFAAAFQRRWRMSEPGAGTLRR